MLRIFVLSISENGYKLPVISFPLAVKLRNNKSARLHADFVDQAVLELVNSGRVRMVNEQPFVVNPLSVSIQPCGKKKLILDMRHVNKSLSKQSVKYEDWKIAMSYFSKGAYLFFIDLKFLRNISLRSRHLRRKSLEVLCDQNPTLIFKIRDRKSAIKCRASKDFFPTCLLPCTRRSHGRYSPHFACLLALFTLARIACLLQLCVKTSLFDCSIWATPE